MKNCFKNKSGLKIGIISSIILFSFCFAIAGQKEFIRDYTYQASEIDSKVSARANASAEMRNILLNEIGTFIKSSQNIINDEYFKDVQTVTAGIVEMIIISENWTGTSYYINAKMTVDDNDVKRRIDAIMKDNQRVDEFRQARQKALDLEMEAYSLRNQPGVSKTEYQQKVSQVAEQDDFTSGLAAYENGNYSTALSFFQNAGNSSEVYYMLGKVYAGLGNSKKSDENFKKAADMGHPAAQYRIRKGGYQRR